MCMNQGRRRKKIVGRVGALGEGFAIWDCIEFSHIFQGLFKSENFIEGGGLNQESSSNYSQGMHENEVS